MRHQRHRRLFLRSIPDGSPDSAPVPAKWQYQYAHCCNLTSVELRACLDGKRRPILHMKAKLGLAPLANGLRVHPERIDR